MQNAKCKMKWKWKWKMNRKTYTTTYFILLRMGQELKYLAELAGATSSRFGHVSHDAQCCQKPPICLLPPPWTTSHRFWPPHPTFASHLHAVPSRNSLVTASRRPRGPLTARDRFVVPLPAFSILAAAATLRNDSCSCFLLGVESACLAVCTSFRLCFFCFPIILAAPHHFVLSPLPPPNATLA